MFILILKALWFILPAYIANGTPPVLSKFKKLQKYNKPIDFGKTWKGKEILGKGKTWFGLFFGVLVGTVFGLIQNLTEIEPLMTLELAFMLAFGALVGDLIGSLIKRRMNLARGKSAPILDQLDFIFGAFLFASFVTKINLNYLIILIILTPLLHIGTNILAYELKLKKEPW